MVITRKNNELRTYVNGRCCSKIDITVKQPKPKEKQQKPDTGEKDDKKGEKDDDKKEEEVVKLPERFCVDPQHLALFPPIDTDSTEDAGERGITMRYIKITNECAAA